MRTHLSRDTGSEGPKHDPYSYTRITFERGSRIITMHNGLGQFIILNGVRIDPPDYVRMCKKCTNRWLEHMWQKYTDLTVAQTERALHKIEDPPRCTKCGSKSLHWVSGYPGETLKVCYKCDAIVASHLNMSAIE